ncbi:MAG: type II toxin-antitoxin system RelE/ParE family toxin [Ancrocorticia sp.]|uniref:type II toxin-antitoxin system RelE/ParE family toxin n=1 Tax=Ancrocorticia sp. TaxID=2593684 RepID=UPI003F933C59
MRYKSWWEHPEARAELLDQADFLPAAVAERLIQNAENAVADVVEGPDAWPKVPLWVEPPTLRRRKIKPFRINVVYYLVDNEVRVIAYAHERRNPDYFAQRVE